MRNILLLSLIMLSSTVSAGRLELTDSILHVGDNYMASWDAPTPIGKNLELDFELSPRPDNYIIFSFDAYQVSPSTNGLHGNHIYINNQFYAKFTDPNNVSENEWKPYYFVIDKRYFNKGSNIITIEAKSATGTTDVDDFMIKNIILYIQ
ncbi:hypothetical protein LEO78_18300 [Aeromonas hydrophila]|uniref:hypothetical protein n=1 Tax=Aeromonas hydrophila TaxID=644 RepID=UPI001CF09319|nr:hypothetical protein [Aeromonas hydrophila]UCM61131.1 hypothetical protein LEO78_18300 [Aeromonas hydrophila]